MTKKFISALIVASVILFLPILSQAEEGTVKAMYDAKGNYQGLAKPDGSGGWNITNKNGEYTFHVDSAGNVTDKQGRRTGQVKGLGK